MTGTSAAAAAAANQAFRQGERDDLVTTGSAAAAAANQAFRQGERDDLVTTGSAAAAAANQAFRQGERDDLVTTGSAAAANLAFRPGDDHVAVNPDASFSPDQISEPTRHIVRASGLIWGASARSHLTGTEVPPGE